MADEALIPMDFARLNVTYNNQQGELPDPVSYTTREEDIRSMAEEALRNGDIVGIDRDADASLTDFVVERFGARDDIPYHRISVRPKTAFGHA